MAKTDAQGNYTDHLGRKIHKDLVDALDKKRNATVDKIVNRALRLESRITTDRKKVNEWLADYFAYRDKHTDVEIGTGNVTLNDYSQMKKVVISVPQKFEFDERFSAAEKLIHEYLDELLENSDKEIRAIVDQAFRRDKKNNLNTASVLRLSKIRIEHQKWKKAMQLIQDSMQVEYGKKYIQIMERQPDKTWRTLTLNFSAA